MRSPVLYKTMAKPINPLNALTVQVTSSLLMFERGKLSTSTQQIPMSQVQDVDTSQSMTQKARNVGSVVVHVLRPTGPERVQLDDLPDFRTLHACINDVSRNARLAEMRARQTHHYATQPPAPPVQQRSPMPPQQPAAARPSADAVLAQLEQLGKLRDVGVVTEEEFQAKKSEMLGRL